MAFIQRFQTLGYKTFGTLVERYAAKIMERKPKGVNEIHFVGDHYDFPSETSIKTNERIFRRNTSTPQLLPAENCKIPNWKVLMKSSRNKATLLAFISQLIWVKKGHPYIKRYLPYP